MRNVDIKLIKWKEETPQDNRNLWIMEFYEYINFWCADILPLFDAVTGPIPDTNMDGLDSYYDQRATNINKIHDIVGQHFSKSIKHPVVKITYKGFTIVFRYNFFGYEVYIDGEKWLTLPQKDIFVSKNARFFYEGFPDEYKTELRYEHGRRKFMVAVADHNRFFAFMVILRNEIDRIQYLWSPVDLLI
ncbi:MAG: hypothetical protein LBT06_10745 [Hungatella sp.]|jgi:hypothetical protein|nr:hypothetical protein [Hungatella sp.]